jgi:hypothetical protein
LPIIFHSPANAHIFEQVQVSQKLQIVKDILVDELDFVVGQPNDLQI